jgi:hypothetical protein
MPDTPSPLADQIPSAWSVYIPIVTGLVRNLLAAAGAAGFTWALAVNDSQVQMAVSLTMVVASALWSGWQKLQAARAIRVAAARPAGAAAPKLPA